MPKQRSPRRKSSERKLQFYRVAKEFCVSYSLPEPTIQFTKGSRGYVVNTRIIEVSENTDYGTFYHALGHHRYFLTHSLKDQLLKQLCRVLLVSGASLLYFDLTSPLPFLLLLLSHSHHVVRQFYAEKHVPKNSRSLKRWLRLLAPISQ